jgi:hypothetical protein
MSWDILRRVDAPNTTIDNRPAITRFGRNHSRNIAAPEREFIQETIAVSKYFGGAASLCHHGVPHHDESAAFGSVRFTRKPLMGCGVISRH